MEEKTVINLGPVQQISLGMGKEFVMQKEKFDVAVFRCRDGRLFAIESRCPHKQVSLADGLLGGETVVCPGHGHKFNLATGRGSEEGEFVKTFKVWEENGMLLLEYSSFVPGNQQG